MNRKVPLSELQARMKLFRDKMDIMNPDWELAVIFSKVNQYYFAGTMQDGMILIPRDGEAEFWVRRSYERAVDESLFPNIKPMNSYRDAASCFGSVPDAIYVETEIVPVALLNRFRKHFPFETIKPADGAINSVRAVKSRYELELMEKSGRIHQKVLEEQLPNVFREGMTEAELALEVYSALVKEGHDANVRFGMFDTPMILGHICFGESSVYPTFFDGPGGNFGMSPAVPSFGSREHKLKTGDLIFIDAGCAVDGYHTDKTMTYMFGRPLPEEVIAVHRQCVEIQNEAASMLKPGAIPAEIYKTILNRLSPDFLVNFMGFGSRRVKFLGHGIGLAIDEYPVIAEGFTEPLHEGMVIALEPKKGIEGIGMVGIENTFIVTPEGGKCITGCSPGLIPV
ncbi:MAG: aminopeptidase P family protein [Clostridiaceae bacterium]|jgi:Xaa-Pro aminopeptidase|nr:aminopeptidase P family protein [Clostridiaceae bacterium]